MNNTKTKGRKKGKHNKLGIEKGKSLLVIISLFRLYIALRETEKEYYNPI